MTIWNLHQIRGVRMSKIDLCKWILNNEDDRLYDAMKESLESDNFTIEEFTENISGILEEHDITYDLDVNRDHDKMDSNGNNPFLFRILEITHDIKSPVNSAVADVNDAVADVNDAVAHVSVGEVVIGVIVGTINLKVCSRVSIDPEFQLPIVFSDGIEDYNEAIVRLGAHPLFKDKEIKTYLVQDGCACCT